MLQSLPQTAGQSQVFQKIAPLSQIIPKGQNLTVLAYGHTGSGKTYTMFGDWGMDRFSKQSKIFKKPKSNAELSFLSDGSCSSELPNTNPPQGLVHQCLSSLFKDFPNAKVYLSLFEIYNETILDLLNRGNINLQLFEDKRGSGVIVQDLSTYKVSSYEEAIFFLQKGYKLRQVRETSFNRYSSRSHTLVNIKVILPLKHATVKSQLLFVDLAGSEKFSSEALLKKEHGKETTAVNKSLSCLSRVVLALRRGDKSIPYRDSKLTRLLKNSFQRSGKVFFLLNLTSLKEDEEQNVHTLEFASELAQIQRRAVKPIVDEKLKVKKLESEVSYLKQVLGLKSRGRGFSEIVYKMKHLSDENEQLRKNQLTHKLKKKLKKKFSRMKEQISEMSVRLDNSPGRGFDIVMSPVFTTQSNYSEMKMEEMKRIQNESLFSNKLKRTKTNISKDGSLEEELSLAYDENRENKTIKKFQESLKNIHQKMPQGIKKSKKLEKQETKKINYGEGSLKGMNFKEYSDGKKKKNILNYENEKNVYKKDILRKFNRSLKLGNGLGTCPQIKKSRFEISPSKKNIKRTNSLKKMVLKPIERLKTEPRAASIIGGSERIRGLRIAKSSRDRSHKLIEEYGKRLECIKAQLQKFEIDKKA